MDNHIKNYEQDQKLGKEKQTVIIDDQLTGETDELDPLFDKEQTNPAVEIEDEDDYFLEEDSDLEGDEDDLFPAEEDLKDDF